MSALNAPAPRRVEIPAGHELRVELDRDEVCTIRLTTGLAEIFGMELASGVVHPFGDEARFAVHSFTGAGNPSTEYVSDETPMTTYLNLHMALEKIRVQAAIPRYDEAGLDVGDEVMPPRLMIVGERNSGKTTVAKSLVNWALRSARTRGGPGSDKPNATGSGITLVNLDPGEGGCTIPGTATVAPIYETLPSTSPVHTFGTIHSTGPPLSFPNPPPGAPWQPEPNPDTMAPPIDALSLFYGHVEPFRNGGLASLQLARISQLLSRKLDPRYCDETLWRNGVLVDTPSEWTEKGKNAIIAKACRELGISHLLVVGGEKLFIEMRKLLDTNRTVTVVRIPKSPGVADLDTAYRRRVRDKQLKSYFYGGPPLSHGALNPHKVQIPFEFLKVYRVGEEYHAPSSALPIGATRATSETQLVELDPKEPSNNATLVNAVLALPQALDEIDVENDADNDIAAGPVLGFVHISGIDVAAGKWTCLIPSKGRLPRTRALIGSLDWVDQ